MCKMILVAESDRDTRDLLEGELSRGGFDCVCADSGRRALALMCADEPDLVVLGRALPDSDGHDVCRRMRQISTVPIIMIGDDDDWVERVVGLELGADDYVTKPFGPCELIERIRAHLRRVTEYAQSAAWGDVLDFGELKIYRDTHDVLVRGERRHFAPKEFDLLTTLAENEGRTMRSADLLDRVWDWNGGERRYTLGVHISRLRSKVERNRHEPEIILTVPSVGYRFMSPNRTAPGR